MRESETGALMEERKLCPIAKAFFDGFASSNANWHGDDLPLEISRAFDKAIEYAKENPLPDPQQS